MEGVPVGLAVYGGGAHSQGAAGSDDAAGNLATVGDEEFMEHRIFRKLPEKYRKGQLTAFGSLVLSAIFRDIQGKKATRAFA